MSRQLVRRDFLRGAAAAAAVPFLISSAALGKDGAIAPSERIGLGFIGLGGRGSDIRGAFLRKDTAALAVADPWSNRHEKVRQALGNQCQGYGDFRDLLARKDIDTVVVAVPEHWHVLISLLAMRAGKDVFCEKPLSLTLLEGRALSDASRQTKRLFQHGTQHRGEFPFVPACELIRNGRIGKLMSIKVGTPGGSGGGSTREIPVPKQLDYDMWLGQAAKIPYVGQAVGLGGWNHRSDYSPGYISAWAVHYIDIAQWGGGYDATGPVRIEGRGVAAKGGFNNCLMTWNVNMAYADGVRLSFSSDGGPNPHGVRFQGSKGWMFVSRGRFDAEPKSLLKEKLGPGEKRLHSGNIYADFLDCVRTRKDTVCDAEIAHRSTSVCHLANIACLTGRKLTWDPAKERFVGDAEADKLLSREMRKPWHL